METFKHTYNPGGIRGIRGLPDPTFLQDPGEVTSILLDTSPQEPAACYSLWPTALLKEVAGGACVFENLSALPVWEREMQLLAFGLPSFV